MAKHKETASEGAALSKKHGRTREKDIKTNAMRMLEKAKIAPKLIYQNALYQATLLRTKQGQRAVDTGKDSSSVNIGHQKDISSGMGGHGNKCRTENCGKTVNPAHKPIHLPESIHHQDRTARP